MRELKPLDKKIATYGCCSRQASLVVQSVAGDAGLIPGSGRVPGEGNGNSLHYSCLENPIDRGTWWAEVCGVATKPPNHLHYGRQNIQNWLSPSFHQTLT